MPAFAIAPTGPFDLAAAAGFGFGPTENTARRPEEPRMRLAFCVDGLTATAAVALRQAPDGTVHGWMSGDADVEIVRRQVARILSLDHDGQAWAAVGERDRVLGRLQRAHDFMRPVLFHSPYEAATWAVISARRPAAQGARVRDAIADELGDVHELDGWRVAAFPPPARLREIRPGPGLPEVKAARLRAVADAALAGDLDQDRLVAMAPAAGLEHVQRLPGIGPFYAQLIIVRATGHADVLPAGEGRTLAAVAHFYGLEAPPTPHELEERAEVWRPLRTWAAVLLHAAGRRAGLRPQRG